MARKTMTDYEVEQEIARLKASPLVALAKALGCSVEDLLK